jgi:hypothetical protein
MIATENNTRFLKLEALRMSFVPPAFSPRKLVHRMETRAPVELWST